MKKDFSSEWIGSKQPRKQRKYRHGAPLHIRRSMIASHLSPELRKSVGKRSVAVKKGDDVKIVRGSFAGRAGKVNSISRTRFAVYIDGIESTRRDGSKVLVPVDASNLVITELNAEDKKRMK
jgi:large subunit ribosomal protein L24